MFAPLPPCTCTWKGLLTYRPCAAGRWRFSISTTGKHDDMQHKHGGAFTARQKSQLRLSKSKQVHGKLVSVNKLQESPPAKTQSQNLSRRDAKQKCPATQSKSTQGDKPFWTVADLEDMHRQRGLQEGNPSGAPRHNLLLLEKKAYIDDKGKQQWHAVYSPPELCATPQRFVNKTHYKVVADATFREHKAYTVFLSDLVDDDSTEDKRVSLKNYPLWANWERVCKNDRSRLSQLPIESMGVTFLSCAVCHHLMRKHSCIRDRLQDHGRAENCQHRRCSCHGPTGAASAW